MAAAELRLGASVRGHSGQGARRRSLPGAVGLCYLGLWAATLIPAGLIALLSPPLARSLIPLSLRGAPAASLSRAGALAAHNLPLAAWPLGLATLGAHRHHLSRRLADALVIVSAAANSAPVAVALGGYGWALLPYLPQLPLEWGSLAVGYAGWLAYRKQPPWRARGLALLGAIAALSLFAGTLETFAVPHRGAAQSTGRLNVERRFSFHPGIGGPAIGPSAANSRILRDRESVVQHSSKSRLTREINEHGCSSTDPTQHEPHRPRPAFHTPHERSASEP